MPAKSSAIEVVGFEAVGAAFAVGLGLGLAWEEEARLVEVVVGFVGLGAERRKEKEGGGSGR